MASASRLSRSLSSLHCWKLLWYYTGPTSCLIETLIFNVLFLWCFPPFLWFCFIWHHSIYSDQVISVLCTQIELSLLAITTRHAPLLLICYKCVWVLVGHKSVFHYIYLIFNKSMPLRIFLLLFILVSVFILKNNIVMKRTLLSSLSV